MFYFAIFTFMKNIWETRRHLPVLILLSLHLAGRGQVVLRYEDNYSLTYHETIRAYRDLDSAFAEASLIEYGTTDAGKPLHLFVVSANGCFDPGIIHGEGKAVLFILNGIHPGESCGIDASVEFARNLLDKNGNLHAYLENTVVCIIPVYNIGGALNRSFHHRANQEIPIEGGFRGNARNLDLNRDFIKLDSRNAQSFTCIFHTWDPDVFLDNHVTNGSDHQYTLTLISNVPEKMHPGLRRFLDNVMLPGLYAAMELSPYSMCPYVDLYNGSPDKGIIQSMDPPMYSLGYAALFNTLSFLNETHIYKSFPDQVKATFHFMKALLTVTSENAGEIVSLRSEAVRETCRQSEFVLEWELDTTRSEKLWFTGYARKERVSEITGQPYLYYDRNEPWEKEIPYYRHYRPVQKASRPDCFIIPQAWHEVIERLKMNRIEMAAIEYDTVMKVEVTHIEDITYSGRPYNGHFRHSGIKISKSMEEVHFYRGDRIIPMNQPGNRYLMQTLDPRGGDSFMQWNFFDPVLERREYFDRATFDDKAMQILESDPMLKAQFELRKAGDPDFASSHNGQLSFIYQNSPWSEKTCRRYPVYRVSNDNIFPPDR